MYSLIGLDAIVTAVRFCVFLLLSNLTYVVIESSKKIPAINIDCNC